MKKKKKKRFLMKKVLPKQGKACDQHAAPSLEDWGDPRGWNFETQYGFSKLYEKPLEEVYGYFEYALLISETLSDLPEIPMRFYFRLFLDHLIEWHSSLPQAACSASAAFYTCEYGLKNNRSAMVAVMPDVLRQLEFIASNQALFDEVEDDGTYSIFNYREHFDRVMILYEKSK